MTEPFNALVIRESTTPGQSQTVAIEALSDADLPDGDVIVDIDYSSLNYKDGMTLTGTGRIIRNFPMVPGIDFSGTVATSSAPDFQPGDAVILTGWGVGERFWGGYAQRQRVRGEWLVKRPDGLSSLQAMAIGTAGLTAMMCVLALEDGGVSPDRGPIVVTGAAGGVGSVAVAILSNLGYAVTAVTGRPEQHEYLRSLGATSLLERDALTGASKPLQTETWAGAVDTVGSTMLVNVIAQTKYQGVVTACGLAGGTDLATTVMPFILRGVRLQGIDSVMADRATRDRVWARLATDLPAGVLDTITRVVPMSTIADLGPAILAGQTRGRVVVDPNT
ncbi:MAG: putative oxidoreductase [Acidimicrobiales bacterium]|nr:putative oxidoreductase [Acidimicrobiales bacterium]